MAVNWPVADGISGKRERPQRIFMNKRRKSLYNEGAENGFVFRTLPKLPAGNSSTIQRESADGGFTFRRVTEPTTTDVNSSFDTGLDEAEKADEALRRQLEVKSFIAHLKKDLIAAEEVVSESDLDRVLEQIEADLSYSDVYFGYLESHDDEAASQNPLVHQLQESIDVLKASSETYKRELKEWDDVLKAKKTEVDEWKKDIESERDVDFRHLTPDDVEILRTYLTPDQKKMLEDLEKTPPGFDHTFLEQSNAHLNRITVTIEKEMEAIHNRCYAVLGKTHTALSGVRHHEWNKPEETPRTVFKSLKEL